MKKPIRLYEEILNQGPSQSTLHLILDQIRKEGRPKEVIKWCTQFLRVYPNDPPLRMLLAESFLDMGLPGPAETEFLKVLAMSNDVMGVHSRLARVYETERRFDEAAVHAKMFLAHHPDDSEMAALLKRMENLDAEVKEGAPDRQGDVWPVIPDDEDESPIPFATPTIAELYYSQGQLKAAVETYERVVRDHPDNAVSVERLSQLKAELEGSFSGFGREAVYRKEKRLLSVLNQWLPKVREIRYG